MKRFLIILLSIIVLFQCTGFFLAFQIEQYKIKREVKRLIRFNIPDTDLNCFTFHKNQIGINSYKIKWIHSREFEFLGQRFDIVRHQLNGDSIKYYCYHDIGEETLFKKYAGTLNGGKSSKAISLKIIVNPLSFSFYKIEPCYYPGINIIKPHLSRFAEPKGYANLIPHPPEKLHT